MTPSKVFWDQGSGAAQLGKPSAVSCNGLQLHAPEAVGRWFALFVLITAIHGCKNAQQISMSARHLALQLAHALYHGLTGTTGQVPVSMSTGRTETGFSDTDRQLCCPAQFSEGKRNRCPANLQSGTRGARGQRNTHAVPVQVPK